MNGSLAQRRLFDLVDVLIDDHVGIIRHVHELKRRAGAPDFFHFYAQACNTVPFSRRKNFANAGGASWCREDAMAKAIGEAVERYASALYDAEEYSLTSFDDAPFPCVPPGDFALYSHQQYAQSGFPYVPFEKHTAVRWTPAQDLTTDRQCYVPAAMVYLPYEFDKDLGENPIAQRISTGLACHSSFAEAGVSAICEVIERDAFTITWQARLATPHIRMGSLSDRNRDLVDRFKRVGDSITLLDITLEHGVPSVLAILGGRAPEAPAHVFAASTDMDPEKAVRKSLEELAHTRQFAQQLQRTRGRLVAQPPYDAIVDNHSHVHFYCDHANAHLAEFLFSSETHIDFKDMENLATGNAQRDLGILIQKVRDTGHRVLLADLTTPDIGDLGLTVVRAIIAGFHPLFMGHHVRALGGSRLWEVPQKLGYSGITRQSGDNPAPHPYP